MNRILENEINRLIGRFPTDAELKSALEYIDTFADEQTTGDRLAVMVGDWLDDCMAECVYCGKYHLKEEMVVTYAGHFCDDECVLNYDRESLDLDAAHEEAYRNSQIGF